MTGDIDQPGCISPAAGNTIQARHRGCRLTGAGKGRNLLYAAYYCAAGARALRHALPLFSERGVDMIEVFQFVARFCFWGLLALIALALLSLGVWCVTVVIRGMSENRRQRQRRERHD